MNKLLKKAGVTAAAVLLAASSTAVSVSAEEVRIDGNHMVNGSIDVYVNSGYSRFAMSDAQGRHLLFDCTSRFVSSVDGYADTVYFSNCNRDAAAKTFTMNYQNSKSDITATLRIVGNTVTGKEDTVEITMITKNIDTVNHEVGSRIMLDTELGSNDDAPYRVSGYGEVTKRMQCSGNDIPLSYNTFDSLTNPQIVTAGTFLPGNAKPDIVQFTNYDVSREGGLVPVLNSSLNLGDSTVNAIWNERTLAPGQSLMCRTYYGLSAIDISSNSELALGANKSSGEFAVNEDSTGYENVSVMSFLQNTGLYDLSNVEVSLQLPAGVSIVDGNTSKTYSALAAGSGVTQDTWVLKAEPSGNERSVKVIVNAKSDQTGAVEPVELTFTIPAIEGAPTIDEVEETQPETQPETQAETKGDVVPGDDSDNIDPPASDEQSETKPVSTPSEATPDGATPDNTTDSKNGSEGTNGAIQTGAALPVVVILSVLVSATSAAYYFKKKQG